MKPFITKNYIEPSGIQKLMGKVPKENFLVDLNNLLAENSLDELIPGQILQIAERYNLQNPTDKFDNELMQILHEFLVEHLGNRLSRFNDFDSAKKMQILLGLSDDDFEKVYRPQAIEIFTETVSDTLNRTKKRGDEEEAIFEQLSEQLGLTEQESTNVISEVVRQIVQNFLQNMIADYKYSPDEKAAYEKICQQYGVDAVFDNPTKQLLEKCENFWRIENGELPVYETKIFLQKGEVCHYLGFAKLYENKTKTTRVRYGGPVFRFKITKSLFYRMADMRVDRETKDFMTLIDSGNLYVTNKRILFTGSKANKVIRYGQIVDLTPYRDGIKISKDSGGAPIFELSNPDGEVLTSTIVRIIQDTTA